MAAVLLSRGTVDPGPSVVEAPGAGGVPGSQGPPYHQLVAARRAGANPVGLGGG
jgi:hypothetical protein